jgi:hypothetical protein
MLKRLDYRVVLGVLLILGGGLMLLDRLDILHNATDYFWAALFALAGGIFLYYFFTDKSKWWAAIPGFALLGMAASSFFLDRIGLGGLAFLGGLGLGFWGVYFARHEHWWAIIPGGVLLTLGASSAMTEFYRFEDSGGVFFVGLGLTFLLVGVLARMRWAYIPAAILLVLGIVLGTPFVGIFEYVWIGALVLGGLVLIGTAILKKEE